MWTISSHVRCIILAHNGEDILKDFIEKFTGDGGCRAKHIGPLNWYLGLEIDQHDDYSVTLKQTKYIEKLLTKFTPDHEHNNVKHSYPCNPSTFIRLGTAQSDEERDRMKSLPYKEIIGSILYLSTMTRPDIAYYICVGVRVRCAGKPPARAHLSCLRTRSQACACAVQFEESNEIAQPTHPHQQR